MGNGGTRNVTDGVIDMMARLRDMRCGQSDVAPFDDGVERTQEEFAKYFGAKKTTYGEWERGKKAPPIKALAAFAEKFSVSLDYLVRGLGTARPSTVFDSREEGPQAKALK